MRKIYCTKCKKYKEFQNPKIWCICYKTLLHFSVLSKCGREDERISKEEE